MHSDTILFRIDSVGRPGGEDAMGTAGPEAMTSAASH
jgi:hypothetical protein